MWLHIWRKNCVQCWQAIAQASELSFSVVFHTKNCAVHSGSSIVSSVYLVFIHHSHTHKKTHRTDKKTDKPDGKPVLCQRTFSSVSRAVFYTVKLRSLTEGVWGPLYEQHYSQFAPTKHAKYQNWLFYKILMFGTGDNELVERGPYLARGRTLVTAFLSDENQTSFFIIKPTRCINFPNLLRHETLHVSGSSSAHHQGFIHCTLSNGICHTGL